MIGQNDNELKELVERFYDPQEARTCLEDFEQAERLLAGNPAPAPSSRRLAAIKANVSTTLTRRRHNRSIRRIAFAFTSVAAAAVFVIAVRVGLFQTTPLTPPDTVSATIIPSSLWESNDIVTADPSLAYFSTEIEQIENELAILQSGEEPPTGDIAITELEMELIEIEGEFWKG